MTIQTIPAVIEHLTLQSVARTMEAGSESATASKRYIEIFDELDSLTGDEFAEVYAVYLIGSGRVHDFEQARLTALADKFLPVEEMAQDAELHVALARGVELHRRFANDA